jgi:DNA invertase Pin-like site-specific DNA recombinase
VSTADPQLFRQLFTWGTPLVDVHSSLEMCVLWVDIGDLVDVSRPKVHNRGSRMSSSTLIGYARVSSLLQDTSIQVEKLKAAGCNVIRKEKVSGKSRDGREQLSAVLDFIRAGDTLVVHKIDRLGRSTRDVLNLVHELETKGAHLRVLEPPISTEGPMGKVTLTVLGMVGEMELGFIKERQREGIDKAKAAGVYKGRPVTLDHTKVLQMYKGGVGATEIARTLRCSRSAIYKVLKAA